MSETKYGVPLNPDPMEMLASLLLPRRTVEAVTVYAVQTDGIQVYAAPTSDVYPPSPVEYDLSRFWQNPCLVERLVRIEEKLDELLRRTAPEASVVEEIRRRVNEALDGVKGK